MKIKYVGLNSVVRPGQRQAWHAGDSNLERTGPAFESNSGIVLSQPDGEQLTDSTEIHTEATSCKEPRPSGGIFAIPEDGTTVIGLTAAGDGSPTKSLRKLSL